MARSGMLEYRYASKRAVAGFVPATDSIDCPCRSGRHRRCHGKNDGRASARGSRAVRSTAARQILPRTGPAGASAAGHSSPTFRPVVLSIARSGRVVIWWSTYRMETSSSRRLAGGGCCDQEQALGGPKDRKLHRARLCHRSSPAAPRCRDGRLEASPVSLKKNGWGSYRDNQES